MKKNILLVDDEEVLVESLKECLLDIAEFAVDTALNVDQALQLIQANSYDLIITDIRMPGKSGIDLITTLKEKKIATGIMIMTAYGNQETFDTLRELGGITVISKPFDINWFKEMLQNYFKQKGVSGTVEAIELTSLLQIINLEKKSAEVEIEINRKTGVLYFRDGELIHAEFADLEGEEAAIRLILLNRGIFHLKPLFKKINQTIFTPFLPFLLNLMKNEDERKKSFLKVSRQSHFNFQIRQKFKQLLDELQSVTGFLASAVISAGGKIIADDFRHNQPDFSAGITNFSHLLEKARDINEQFQNQNNIYLQLEGENFIIIGNCLKTDDFHLHFILILAAASNIAAARLKLKKIADSVIDLFKKEKLQLE